MRERVSRISNITWLGNSFPRTEWKSKLNMNMKYFVKNASITETKTYLRSNESSLSNLLDS
jgi:hypothetical protein